MDEFNNKFPLSPAYDFLLANGLDLECEEIRKSVDTFKKYTSTLRRAKIVVLVKKSQIFEKFCEDVWPSGLTERGKSSVAFYENLVARFLADQDGTSTEEEEEDDFIAEENEFAYENDLQNYLVKNLTIIEKGLRLYESPEGKIGVEFYVPGTSRRIDILATDKDGLFVVIELKVGRGYERVVGQTLFYQSMIKTHFSQEKVRAIIIAREISTELRAATQYLSDFELFEYKLSLTLNIVG